MFLTYPHFFFKTKGNIFAERKAANTELSIALLSTQVLWLMLQNNAVKASVYGPKYLLQGQPAFSTTE